MWSYHWETKTKLINQVNRHELYIELSIEWSFFVGCILGYTQGLALALGIGVTSGSAQEPICIAGESNPGQSNARNIP